MFLLEWKFHLLGGGGGKIYYIIKFSIFGFSFRIHVLELGGFFVCGVFPHPPPPPTMGHDKEIYTIVGWRGGVWVGGGTLFKYFAHLYMNVVTKKWEIVICGLYVLPIYSTDSNIRCVLQRWSLAEGHQGVGPGRNPKGAYISLPFVCHMW